MQKSLIPLFGLTLLLTSGGLHAAVAQTTDSQNAGDPVLPAPKQNNGAYFAPGAVTAGTAVTGAALAAIPASDAGCSALNPCATVTPKLDNLNADPKAAPPVHRANDEEPRAGRRGGPPVGAGFRRGQRGRNRPPLDAR